MTLELLYNLLAPFEDESAYIAQAKNELSKTDFYIDGLSGGENSSQKRAELAKKLNLPSDMTANALLAALKILISYEEYLTLVGRTTENN
jgi:ribonuclease M5